MAGLPEELLDRINATCDDFERAARQGEHPEIEPFLEPYPDAHHVHVLEWLVPVDMELQRAGRLDAGQWPKSVEQYLLQFPTLSKPAAVGCLQSLILAEFRLKQAMYSAPNIPATLERFPQFAQALAPQLRQGLYELQPIKIKFGLGTQHESSISLNKVIQFGRQRTDEPPPFKRCEVDKGTSRLIIARREETHVGRRHATCELVCLGKVAVRNLSEVSLVAVNSTRRIGYEETWVGAPPFLLHVGPKVFHITAS